MVNVITEGHLAILYISGAATAFAAEAMTMTAGGLIYTITDPVKSVWSPTTALTPTWDAGPADGTITYNRLTGQVYSTADESSNDPLTMAGDYLPMAAMLYAKDFSLSIKSKVVETTAMECTTPPVYESRQRALSEVTGTIGDFFTPDAAATFAPAITDYFVSHITAATVFAVKLYVSANYSLLAWVTPDVETIRANLRDVLNETVTFRGVVDADGRVVSQL